MAARRSGPRSALPASTLSTWSQLILAIVFRKATSFYIRELLFLSLKNDLAFLIHFPYILWHWKQEFLLLLYAVVPLPLYGTLAIGNHAILLFYTHCKMCLYFLNVIEDLKRKIFKITNFLKTFFALFILLLWHLLIKVCDQQSRTIIDMCKFWVKIFFGWFRSSLFWSLRDASVCCSSIKSEGYRLHCCQHSGEKKHLLATLHFISE